MKISVFLAKDKSKSAVADKTPMAELKGVPARFTTFPQASRASGAEAVVILTRGRVRSFVATAGEIKLYLSPRAEVRVIEPDPPEVRPAEEPLTLCHACVQGAHERCENILFEEVEDHDCECPCMPHQLSGGAQ